MLQKLWTVLSNYVAALLIDSRQISEKCTDSNRDFAPAEQNVQMSIGHCRGANLPDFQEAGLQTGFVVLPSARLRFQQQD